MQLSPIIKKRLVILVCFGAILLLIALFLHRTQTAPTLGFSNLGRLPGNADSSAADYKDGSLFTSNGRYFIAYNTGTGDVRHLSNTNTLPNISKLVVSPDTGYIAFRVNDDAQDTEPFKTLSASLEDTPAQQWWLLNTATMQFSYVGGGSSLDWIDNQTFAYSAGSAVLIGHTNGTPGGALYLGSGDINELTAVGNTVEFNEQGVGVKKLTVTTKQVSTIDDPVTWADFSPKQVGCYFYSRSAEFEEAQNALVGCTKDDMSLPGAIYSTKFTDDGRYFFYYYKNGDKLAGAYIDISSGKTGSWLYNNKPTTDKDLEIVAAASKDTVVLRSGQDYYGEDMKAIDLIKDTASETVGNLYIDLIGGDIKVIVSKSTPFTASDYTVVDQTLSDMGYDPGVLDISYSQITTDDDRWN